VTTKRNIIRYTSMFDCYRTMKNVTVSTNDADQRESSTFSRRNFYIKTKELLHFSTVVVKIRILVDHLSRKILLCDRRLVPNRKSSHLESLVIDQRDESCFTERPIQPFPKSEVFLHLQPCTPHDCFACSPNERMEIYLAFTMTHRMLR